MTNTIKRASAAALALILLAGCLTGCGVKDNKLFVADAALQTKADEVLANIDVVKDQRIADYLSMRDALLRYNTTTRPKDVKDQLESLKTKYSGLDKDLSLNDGLVNVNEQLFEYLVVRCYYNKQTLNEVLLDSSDGLKQLVLDKGYKYAYEWRNTDEQISTKYCYGTAEVYDERNCYSINTLSDGSVEYMSIPLFYEPLTQQYVERYSSLSVDERAAEFDKSVKYFVEKANIASDEVLALLYSEQQLDALSRFLDGLDIEYLDKNNIAKEDEPYANRQIAVQLGDTRFILRFTLYGMFMDVIQNKDYYKGSFYTGLDILRQAYLGTQPAETDDSIYIVIDGN